MAGAGPSGATSIAGCAAEWTALAINGSVKKSGVCLGLEHLAPTIKTSGADVVTQVQLASGGLNCGTGSGKRIV